MTKKASYLFVYDRKNQAKTKGEGLIELVVNFGLRQRKWVSTKVKIKPNQWNKNRREINEKHSDHIALNVFIKSLREKIEAEELNLINKGRPFTNSTIDDILKGKKQPQTFTEFYRVMVQNDHKIKAGTQRNQMRTLEILSGYKSSIHFSELDYAFIHQFDMWLNEKGYLQSTIGMIHKNVKKYINLAIKYGRIKIDENPYLSFKVKRSKPKHTWLNYQEVKQIEMLELDDVPLMGVVKDMFLFSCYTGLRYSDLIRLNGDSFIHQDGGLGLKLQRMEKVDRPIHLKLWQMFGGKAGALYKKHIERTPDANKRLWQRFVSNPDMNRVLKSIQAEAGIHKKLTIHVGRHTFGTLYAHQTGSIFEVMRAMGISKFETAQVYIDLSAEL